MFDDRVQARRHHLRTALRGIIGDDKFFALLRDWATRYRHATVVTDDFTGLAANHAGRVAALTVDDWLYSTGSPAPRQMRSPGRASPGWAWQPSCPPLCGYAVLTWLRETLTRAGFGFRGVLGRLRAGGRRGIRSSRRPPGRYAPLARLEPDDGPHAHPMRLAAGRGGLRRR